MALIGYARVSTPDQKLSLQHDALERAGCERVFDDQASGARSDRPGLAEALAYLRASDTLEVWKLDRLGRSMSHLIETVGELAVRDIGFHSVTESIDTTTPGGMLVFNIFGSLAQLASPQGLCARQRFGGHNENKGYATRLRRAMGSLRARNSPGASGFARCQR